MQKVAYNAMNSLIIDSDSPLPTVQFTARGDCEVWMVCMLWWCRSQKTCELTEESGNTEKTIDFVENCEEV
jgi:hypothetical protein